MLTLLRCYLFQQNKTQFLRNLLSPIFAAATIVSLIALGIAFAINDTIGVTTYLIFIPIFVICFFLLQRNQTTIVSLITVYGVFAICLYRAFATIGIYAPIYIGLIILIILSTLIYQAETGFILAAIGIISGLGMVFAIGDEMISTLAFDWIPVWEMWSALATMFSLAALLGYFIRRTSDRAFASTLQKEQALAQGHQTLETEIEQRQFVERQLDESQSLYRVIVQDQPTFVTRWRPDGTLIFVNEALCQYHGKSAKELVGKSFFSWSDADNVEQLKQQLVDMTPDDPVVTSTFQDVDPRGKHIWHRWVDRGIFNDEGELMMIQSVGLDVTAQKQLEDSTIELQVAKQHETFFEDFLSTMTHDLKTPLSIINTSLYLAEKTESGDVRTAHFRKMKKQVKLLEKMINNILSVVRLRNIPELSLEPMTINPMIQQLKKNLQPKADGKDIQLETKLAKATLTLLADSNQLERVLLNLIDNALNYTPEGGAVTVKTRVDEQHIYVAVQDTGIGIPEDELPYVFEQFYRATNAQEIEGGTGLGLAIVKRIVELHNGTIKVESTLNKGTTFRLAFPIAPDLALTG